MSTAKVAQRETSKCATIQFVDKKSKTNSKVVVPKVIASRLTEVNKSKTTDPQALKVDLERAHERRQSIQADRTEKVRRHLERVEKVAELKRQQKTINEDSEEIAKP
ncbi:hypothetical protein FGIG_06969 [Fasciola gigantica]|uniref:Uncharacterized protein n=2 Tax=Fasciola TaxID=6191 RepID=A0A4E0R1P7_FASHE|nr:hypothetical protein D915_007363 [Fasciola hepatica]TPP61490.1 hypothetical protein FGIG_06969 [Fasciola gigantica]